MSFEVGFVSYKETLNLPVSNGVVRCPCGAGGYTARLFGIGIYITRWQHRFTARFSQLVCHENRHQIDIPRIATGGTTYLVGTGIVWLQSADQLEPTTPFL